MRILFTALTGVFLASAASAATIDFTDATCSGGGACNVGTPLDQSYGDMTGVDVIYDRDLTTSGLQDVLYWSTGYEELDGVIYTNQNAGMSVTLEAEAGYEVSLDSLLIAPYFNRTVNTQIAIIDLADGTEVYNSTFMPLSVDGSTEISDAADWTSASGYTILFGPDAFNAGIGSITYSAQQLVAAVPLPAGGALLLLGLAGLGIVRRRRTS